MITWWVLTLLTFDFLILGWLVRPHGTHYWPGAAFLWTVIITTIILWLGGINVFSLIWDHPMDAFIFSISYVIIGIVWSVIHWTLWRNSEHQRSRLASRFATWKDYIKREDKTPTAFRASPDYPYGWKQDYPMILTWVLFWPIDIIFYVLGDFLFHLASSIGHKLAGIYSAIGKGVDRSVIGE